MSTTVDSRVLEMKFDNKHFESNVQTTLGTLDKLKRSLNMSGTSKGLEEVSSAADKVNSPMNGLGRAVESVQAKFSALQVMGVTALANITNSAINTGKRMASALTIDPIKTGFKEYETQINAVQTILANTESKGTTLQQVNAALDELNLYADKTIYNFTEMTKNIGTFTAAGVDLDTSVQAIQGIANLAAVSGSTSQQASTAMYQLSQALASGTVKLMDWNSVVNAGMGGQVFQDALKETARNHGIAIDKMIKDEGSFRETLKEGWLTSEVLTETLSHFTMAAEEGTDQWNAYKKSLMDDGYTAEQAEEIIRLSNTATDAATKVKTFTQLWDTLKESAQSGWTQSWEIMIGDFEEAKRFLTEISDTIGGMIGSSADARNALLSEGFSSGWKQLLSAGIPDEEGYKETFNAIAKEHGVSIDKMVKAEKKLDTSLTDSEAYMKVLKKGFTDGSLTSDMLSKSVHKMADKMSKMSAEELKAAGYTADHVKQIKELSKGIKDGSVSMDEFAEKITKTSGRENVIEALRNAFEGLMSVIKPIKDAFREVFEPLKGEQLYSFTESLVKFTEGLTLSSEHAEELKRVFKGLFSILDIAKKAITSVVSALFGLSQSEGISSLADLLLDVAAAIGDFFTSLNEGFDANGLTGMLSSVGSAISSLLKSATGGLRGFGDIFSSIGQWISNAANKILEVVKNIFTWISDNVSAGDIFAGLAGGGIYVTAKKFGNIADKIKDAIDKLFGKGDGIKKLKDTFVEVLDSVNGALQSFTTGVKVWSIVGIAVAVGILAHSLRTISELKVPDIGKSLIAIGIMLGMLTGGFKSMTKSLTKFESAGIVKSAFSLMLMAKAIDILADVMIELSGLSMGEIAKGLLTIGIAIAELCLGLKIIGKTKVSLSTAAAMLALAQSCSILGDAMQKFGSMSWEEIGRGLTAMGGALTELIAAIAVLKKVGGFKSLIGSASILLLVQGLDDLANAIKKFGSMSWEDIRRGLTAMGGALAEVSVAVAAVGKIAGFSGILGAGAIWVTIQGLDDLANALQLFGLMSWSEIGRGLVAMGGALLEVGAISGALGYLTGMAGLLGAATIWVTVQGLEDLSIAFQQFGSMSWSEIGRGLVAMGGALAEVAIISGGLGALSGIAGLVGAGTILLAVQGLDDLANALQKFGSMSWDEIKRGLAAMGGALGELALGSFLNTLGIIGAATIEKVAAPLGTLADSVKKWKDVEVPGGLGWGLTRLAGGIFSFTLDGKGANVITTIAAPLGTLADSVKKWSDVKVPEDIHDQLDELSNGVFSFTLDGMGASVLSKIASPLGTLADSVKKWSDVTVPENIESDLKGIANGIKAFSWAFMGGWSLNAIVGPLASLPNSIIKWKDVTVPENLEDNLTGIANGIKAFSWTFTGSWSISELAEPLGRLPDSLKKWSDISVPENLKDNLTAIADGISSFSLLDVGKIQAVDDNILTLSTAFQNFASINVDGSILVTFTENITSCGEKLSKLDSTSMTNAATTINTLVTSIKNVNSTDVSNVSAFVTAANSLNDISISSIDIDTDGLASIVSSITSTMNSVNETISASQSSIKTSMGTAMSGAAEAIKAKKDGILSAVKVLTNAVETSISNRKTAVTTSFNTMVSEGVNAIRTYYSSFSSAGGYLGDGLVEGIKSKMTAVYNAAYALGQQAVKGEKEGQASNSPSKLTILAGQWLGEGLVIGIDKMTSKVYKSGYDLGNTATGTISNAISRISDAINTDIDVQPTIRPVLDLSDVSAGASRINSMFGANPSVGVLSNVASINRMMNRNQNGSSDIISAIKDLKKTIGNTSGNTYNIGVNAGEEGELEAAINTIVRVARMEGRT